MRVHRWGILPYEEARRKMEEVHALALEDKENHLILTEHTPCFTVGRDAWDDDWQVPVIKSDRGGSITCHAPGQQIFYFVFQTPSPPKFFKKVVQSFENFFASFDLPIRYEKENPGFYIENRKLCSLGFRYRNGVSLHGVALNRDVDLNFCNRVNPCALSGIAATSLSHEGVEIEALTLQEQIVTQICEVFDESL